MTHDQREEEIANLHAASKAAGKRCETARREAAVAAIDMWAATQRLEDALRSFQKANDAFAAAIGVERTECDSECKLRVVN